MYTAVLNTSWTDYDSIIAIQAAAFTDVDYEPRLSLDWTKALIRIFWAEPTWDTVLATQETEQEAFEYIVAHDAEWNEPNDI